MTDREAMQMALEIIGTHHGLFKHETTTLREALEMALEIIENHPVNYENQIIAIRAKLEQQTHTRFAATHQLNTQVKRQWVGLTDEEWSRITDDVIGFNSCCGWEQEYAKAIEAKLREKNHDAPT